MQSQDHEYCQRIKDITLFYNYDVENFTKLVTSNLHTTLLDLYNKNYKWIFVNAMGHWVSDKTLYDKMIADCEKNCVPLMAHILLRPDSYPNIDEQFFLLDLQTWAAIGFPQLEEVLGHYTFTTLSVNRSDENYHDDYTPYWIRPSKQLKEYKSYAKLFGMELIRKLMENNYSVQNFNQSIRNSKIHLYPNSNINQLKQFFIDGTSTWSHTPEFAKIVSNELATLEKTVYLLNSESIYCPPKQFGPIDHFIGVAAGFKSVLLLNLLGFAETATVSYIDISMPALKYQQYLLDTWDGNLDNYYSISNKYKELNSDCRYAWRAHNSWSNEIEVFLLEANLSKQQFQQLWQKYINLNHKFYQINLLNDYNKLIDLAAERPYDKTYIWISNALDMQWLVFLKGKDLGREIEKNIVQQLDTIKLNYCLESSGYFWYAKS